MSSSIIDFDDTYLTISDIRERGNYEFKQQNYDLAISFYSAAIRQSEDGMRGAEGNERVQEIVAEEYILNLCNRSACYYQIQDYNQSCIDALAAWELSKEKNIKSVYRYAKSVMHLIHTDKEKVEQAKRMLQTIIEYIDKEVTTTTTETATAIAAAKVGDGENDNNNNNNNNDNSDFEITEEMIQKQKEEDKKYTDDLLKQKKALQGLWNQLIELSLTIPPEIRPETSIKHVQRPVSIREFKKSEDDFLGHGNFSDIIIVTHNSTHEKFALKMIEKKRADELYKRQHPNVYNEIHMEKRILLERLINKDDRSIHPGIIRMYHAFQDYTTLYYLMELHISWGDLWSELKYTWPYGTNNSIPYTMVGCHRNQAKQWIYELIDALEYIHSHGVVHRDLKPENILLTSNGRTLIIDFGTAKDLIETDLNGPEFVGTPDFMSPEAVSGDSGTPGSDEFIPPDVHVKKEKYKSKGSSFEADLWALGAIAYILQTGMTPFWCPSPYLAFLKIQRTSACLIRPMGIIEDTCWDLIQKLMKQKPRERLGAGIFSKKLNEKGKIHFVKSNPEGYNVIRNHPYFDSLRRDYQLQHEAKSFTHSSCFDDKLVPKDKIPLELLTTPIPSLQDLCYRAIAIQAYRDSLDIDVLEQHPPGNGNKRHDMILLGDSTNNIHTYPLRAAVLHVLDRIQLLRTEPRLYGRFCSDPVAARLDKVRAVSKDVIGLTQMNDDQCKGPNQQMHDPYAKPIALDPIQIVQLTNPLFSVRNIDSVDEEMQKQWRKLLKRSIANINKARPKLVFVTAASGILRTDNSLRKLLARISETIPIVIHDGTAYFTFWKLGVQCLALQTSTLLTESNDDYDNNRMNMEEKEEEKELVTEYDKTEQVAWVRAHLEQCRMSKHPLFVFVNSDPRTLPPRLLKKLARGRTLCLFGLPKNGTPPTIESSIQYNINDVVDDVSIRSTDSEENAKNDNFTMQLRGNTENGLQWITVNPTEADNWSVKFEPISS